MTSRQLIAFVEEKLAEYGVKKLVPDEDTLQQHARRLTEQQLAAAAIKKIKAELSEEAAKTRVPPDLRKAVEQRLAEEPRMPWDAALAYLLRSDADGDDDEGAEAEGDDDEGEEQAEDEDEDY